MEKVILASRNKGKIKEIGDILGRYDMTVVSRDNAGLPIDEVEETGETFEENSYIKAKAILDVAGVPTVADDSGLMVDALGGAPGVYSARYAGDHDDEANIVKVLEKLQGVPTEERTARFCCALAIAGPMIETTTLFGTCEGIILEEKRGANGFGYDPIFFVPSLNRAMAELTPEEKGSISHRGNAIRQLADKLPTLL